MRFFLREKKNVPVLIFIYSPLLLIIGGVLAHAFYPMPEPVYSLAGDAHFDDEEAWWDGPHQGEC